MDVAGGMAGVQRQAHHAVSMIVLGQIYQSCAEALMDHEQLLVLRFLPDFSLAAVNHDGTVSLAHTRGSGPCSWPLPGLYSPFCRRHVAELGPTGEPLKGVGVDVRGVVATPLDKSSTHGSRSSKSTSGSECRPGPRPPWGTMQGRHRSLNVDDAWIRFLAELRRRKVVHTAIVYAALAWAAIEAVTSLLPVFGGRDTVVRIMVALIPPGFPRGPPPTLSGPLDPRASSVYLRSRAPSALLRR